MSLSRIERNVRPTCERCRLKAIVIIPKVTAIATP